MGPLFRLILILIKMPETIKTEKESKQCPGPDSAAANLEDKCVKVPSDMSLRAVCSAGYGIRRSRPCVWHGDERIAEKRRIDTFPKPLRNCSDGNKMQRFRLYVAVA